MTEAQKAHNHGHQVQVAIVKAKRRGIPHVFYTHPEIQFTFTLRADRWADQLDKFRKDRIVHGVALPDGEVV